MPGEMVGDEQNWVPEWKPKNRQRPIVRSPDRWTIRKIDEIDRQDTAQDRSRMQNLLKIYFASDLKRPLLND